MWLQLTSTSLATCVRHQIGRPARAVVTSMRRQVRYTKLRVAAVRTDKPLNIAMATGLSVVHQVAKETNVQRVIFKNDDAAKSASNAAVSAKDFYWDHIVVILVSAILGLSLLDIVSEYFRGAGVQCFSPSTVNESDEFTRAQADFVNDFCSRGLPPTQYYSSFILVHGLGLVAPHYLWKALFGAYFTFFFELANGLKGLRSTTTGEYAESNFESVYKLQQEYGKSLRMFRFYYLKLLLQLGIAALSLILGVAYFDNFRPNFFCPGDLNTEAYQHWPLGAVEVTCVYISLRFLSIVRGVDMAFVALTIPCILYGLGWCFVRHTKELGYAKIAHFVTESCFLARHYRPRRFSISRKSPFRISNDLDFLLMELFQSDAGRGEVFREVQVGIELIRRNKQNSEWLQLHFHAQTNMGQYGACLCWYIL